MIPPYSLRLVKAKNRQMRLQLGAQGSTTLLEHQRPKGYFLKND
jgi:hypothetical protein